MVKKFFGFTLGEVLIALGVIGVVASLVIPQLINGHKSGTARAQFDTAYAMLAKSITEMEADDVPVEPGNYTTSGSFFPKFLEYNKVTINCGKYISTNTSVCFSTADSSTDNTYNRFDGNPLISSEKSLFDDGAFVVNNGMLVMIENVTDNPSGLLITVDINGKNKKPNRWGYDLFTFELIKGGQLLPVGAPGTGVKSDGSKNSWVSSEAEIKRYCSQDSTRAYNGITCAYFASTDQDYFKKLYRGH